MNEGRQTPSLRDALVELSFLIQAMLARLASEHEVSLIQVRLLGILRDREPGIVELAEMLNLDKSSVSGLVDRAQSRGLVARAAAKGSDGRAIRVLLTPTGRRLTNRFAQQVSDELAALVQELSPAQRRRLAELSSRVIASSQARAGRQPPRASSAHRR